LSGSETVPKMNEKSRSIELAANLLSLVLIVTILYYLQSIIVPLLFAILIAISLFPIARQLENWRLPKVAAAIISVIIAIAVIARSEERRVGKECRSR